MAVKVISGDIIKAYISGEVDSIAHCVNCSGIMGAGLAKQIKIELPTVYTSYRKRWLQETDKKLLLGTAQKVTENHLDRDRAVFNLYAQFAYGTEKRHVNYGALGLCLQNMSQQIREPNTLVGFPYLMCCGLAKGDWNIVLEMIEFFFQHHNVKIYKLE
jgi:O-acetyl-ADP-ribose deacetylase (regulator of RNase III)